MHGPGLRMVVDMADVKQGKGGFFSIESGQSGNVLSMYVTQASMILNANF